MPGKFITIEGGDGAGKSTQLGVIESCLEQAGIDYLVTREPGGTPVGEQLRQILLDHDGDPLGDDTELLLMFAARAEHVQAVIRPALARGRWVVSDRFHDASFAYQGARGIETGRIKALSDWVLQGFQPDLTLFFDLPLEQGLTRVNHRGGHDRFERESLDFKAAVQAIYRQRAAAEPGRIRVIDASLSIAGVSAQVRQEMVSFIGQWEG